MALADLFKKQQPLAQLKQQGNPFITPQVINQYQNAVATRPAPQPQPSTLQRLGAFAAGSNDAFLGGLARGVGNVAGLLGARGTQNYINRITAPQTQYKNLKEYKTGTNVGNIQREIAANVGMLPLMGSAGSAASRFVANRGAGAVGQMIGRQAVEGAVGGGLVTALGGGSWQDIAKNTALGAGTNVALGGVGLIPNAGTGRLAAVPRVATGIATGAGIAQATGQNPALGGVFGAMAGLNPTERGLPARAELDRIKAGDGRLPGKVQAKGNAMDLPQEQAPNIASTKNRGFTTTVAESGALPPRQTKKLAKETYTVASNADTLAEAKSILAKGTDFAEQQLTTLPTGAVKSALAQQLALSYNAVGNRGKAASIIVDAAREATAAGQYNQALALWNKLTPDGAELAALRTVGDYNQRTGKTIQLSPEARNDLRTAAEKIEAFPEGSVERNIATAQLLQKIDEQVPASFGSKLAEWQTLAQLLNIKTQVRNIAGNLVNAVTSSVSDVFGSGLDVVLSVKSGSRTKAIPNTKKAVQGFLAGGKEAAQYAKAGVRTPSTGGQFDLQNAPALRGKVGRTLNKALNASLGVPDRAFYQSAYDSTLDSIMRASNVQKPAQWMLDAAEAEALYRTFQNDSAIGTMLQTVKRAANFGKDFGLGDLILKYPKTPGNIASVGLDYSPIGLIKGLVSLHRFLKNPIAANQFETANQLGRAITGTLAIGGGVALAKAGIISGADKDTTNIDKTQQAAGVTKYQFNPDALGRLLAGDDPSIQVGDRLLSYDWVQPLAIALSTGAEITKSEAENEQKMADLAKVITNTMLDGASSLINQPVFQGVQRFMNYGDPIGGAIDTLAAAPASFIPTLSSQLRNTIDPTLRQTSGNGIVGDTVAQVANKIPGLSQTLTPQTTVEGVNRQINPELSGISRFLQMFINPANMSTYKPSAQTKEVLDLFKETGNTDVALRSVGKSITVDGKNYTLTPEQITTYQRFMGQGTQDALAKVTANQAYQRLSDEQKAKVVAGVIDDEATKVRDMIKSDVTGQPIVSSSGATGVDKRIRSAQEKDARDRITSGASNREQVGNKIFVSDGEGGVRTINTEKQQKDLQTLQLDTQIANAKQSNNYREWESLLEQKFKALRDETAALDPSLDAVQILKNQNQMDSLLGQVAKYRGYGGSFRKPKRVSAPKVRLQKVKFATQKAPSLGRVRKVKAYRPPKIRNVFS